MTFVFPRAEVILLSDLALHFVCKGRFLQATLLLYPVALGTTVVDLELRRTQPTALWQSLW